MGLHLIFADALSSWGWFALNVLEVVIGLGMVIFVHELGHFVVAKLCGVRCDKFYLGFDIGGWKLARFRWGETEYGIGILPFGGYVKMLGQEDNPARLREELERAKAQQAEAAANPQPAATPSDAPAQEVPTPAQSQSSVAPTTSSAGRPAEQPADLAEAEQALYNPRSFLAQTVPERMAIISAGVIMNVVFALITGTIAYAIGVRQIECVVGNVFPGEAAWKAGLRTGDRIEEIAGRRTHRFNDLQRSVSLGDIDDGVSMVVKRPGVAEPIALTLIPDRKRLAPTIGISNGYTTRLAEKLFAWPGSTAQRAQPAFQANDRVIRIDDVAIERYDQIEAYLDQHPEKPVQVTVERSPPQANKANAAGVAVEQVKIEVPPAPMRTFGLVMAMGPVTAVQADSPAMAAGILEGDRIVAVDGQSPGDPATLPDRLRGKSEVALTIQREGRPDRIPLRMKLRELLYCQPPVYPGNAAAVPQLGLAYQILNRVEQVEPDSPAAKAGIAAGDVIHSATLVANDKKPSPQGSKSEEDDAVAGKEPIPFDDDNVNWAYFVLFALQKVQPGATFQFDLGNDRKATIQAVDAKDWFNPDRGLRFEAMSYLQKAESIGEAVSLGAGETWHSLTLVYRTLTKIGHQVSPKAFGGPIEILRQASYAASQGMSDLMLFLTLISANLALLNFLPIPVLDGGHMVFLMYEGITGRMPNERVYVGLMYLGLLLLLALMVWVLGLDSGLIPRH